MTNRTNFCQWKPRILENNYLVDHIDKSWYAIFTQKTNIQINCPGTTVFKDAEGLVKIVSPCTLSSEMFNLTSTKKNASPDMIKFANENLIVNLNFSNPIPKAIFNSSESIFEKFKEKLTELNHTTHMNISEMAFDSSTTKLISSINLSASTSLFLIVLACLIIILFYLYKKSRVDVVSAVMSELNQLAGTSTDEN